MNDLVDPLHQKYAISKSKIIQMADRVVSSHYRTTSDGKRGNKLSWLTYHSTKGFVDQEAVNAAVKDILTHEFIDCGYRLICTYLRKEGYQINHKKLKQSVKQAGMLKIEDW